MVRPQSTTLPPTTATMSRRAARSVRTWMRLSVDIGTEYAYEAGEGNQRQQAAMTDEEPDHGELGMTWADFGLDYRGSFFHNDLDSLTVDNPASAQRRQLPRETLRAPVAPISV